MAFALELLPPTEPALRSKQLLGLSVPLRLALTAQAAGAIAIVCPDPETRRLLDDRRLAIPVRDARPSGVFLVSAPASLVVHRGLIAAFREARGDRDGHLVDDRVAFAPPFGFDPIDVADRAALARARRALLRSLRKPQDGWTSTYLNRHVSLFFTRFLVATPLTPNVVSIFILGIGLAGAWLATKGDYRSLLLGAFLFQMQSILDGCDGEMSRLTFRGSKAGEWLDTVGDDLTNYGFFAGAAYGLFHRTGHPLYLAAGATVVLCGVLTSAIEYRYLVSIGSGDLLKYPIGVGKAPGAPDEKKSGLGALLDSISPLFKRDTFVFLTLIAAALSISGVMLVVFALGAIGIFVAVLNAELRMARERRAKA